MNDAWLGCDPDMDTTAFAMCDVERVIAVWIVRPATAGLVSMSMALRGVFGHLPTVAGIVIESPMIYPNARTANPQEILELAQVAGLVAHEAVGAGLVTKVVYPVTWKGQVKKDAHQAIVLERYGIEFKRMKNYCRPTLWPAGPVPLGVELIQPEDWKHVCDAIGLARYGALGLKSLGKETRRRGPAGK